MKILPFILAAVILINISSCKKDAAVLCESLKEAAFLNRVDSVKTQITSYIQQLPSKTYNQQNIELLVQKMSACDISSSLLCFNCIYTLPAQTEISLDFFYGGVQTRKVIDLSYTTDNKIVFVNVHD